MLTIGTAHLLDLLFANQIEIRNSEYSARNRSARPTHTDSATRKQAVCASIHHLYVAVCM